MTYILLVSIILGLFLTETGYWKTLFRSPAKRKKILKFVPYIPVASVIVLRIVLNNYQFTSFYQVFQLTWMITVEELLFRGIPFLYLNRNKRNIITTSFLFGLYSLIFTQNVNTFAVYFLIGCLYASSANYYNFVQTTVYRIVATVLLFTI